MEDTVEEFSLIEATIGPLVPSLPILLALNIVAFELNLALAPRLAAIPMLKVVAPVAIVGGPLRVDEGALSVGHSIRPHALVYTPVCLGHASLPLHLVHDELAYVSGAILPDHDPHSILQLSVA